MRSRPAAQISSWPIEHPHVVLISKSCIVFSRSLAVVLAFDDNLIFSSPFFFARDYLLTRSGLERPSAARNESQVKSLKASRSALSSVERETRLQQFFWGSVPDLLFISVAAEAKLLLLPPDQ